ncbi:hypothetical protein GCM10010909_04230 [Acidocella aquatica]|uniref:Amine oxidase domain-containing protein n=1 Tax=Acidocella aquatica TaxID=1922313 RepID=A0ABQ6A3B0_9PROT|nr:FAD-dependent oxidoreductase [Acidocella aquatica]GLR65745.1 hypothetical protein GCM10010909_04230 [Acidocella aquatica]
MTNHQRTVLIAGGGLAGLTSAYLLHREGIGFELFEARDRLGGRVMSLDASGNPAAEGFDLGPSWFWPQLQPRMAEFVEALGLTTFAQNSEGDVLFHRMSREAPQRYRGMAQEAQSMRLVGGTGALIAALAASLPAHCLHIGARVTALHLREDGVEAALSKPDGNERMARGAYALLAAPPRLLEAAMSFFPALPPATAGLWRAIPTWMAPHAKFLALYDRPFWREAGLSGTAQSMAGPMMEIHDATTASGQAALFGFLGVPTAQRSVAGEAAITAACVQQLALLFGPEAGMPRATLFKDWAADKLTATAADQIAGGHPAAGVHNWVDGAWAQRLLLAGSETSPLEPGYLAGAVEAAIRAVAELRRRIREEKEDN